jgi:citrate lyase subunit beta/citryl-CoA lyase
VLRRSALFVPGINSRALEKSRELNCDAVILDLEDSVAGSRKAQAREQVVQALLTADFGHRFRAVRVNPLSTPDGREDLEAAVAAGADGIVLPKVETTDDLITAAERMPPRGMELWAMIESARGIVEAANIAGASRGECPQLTCLIIGPNDIIKSTRIIPSASRRELLPWFMTLVAAAKAFDLALLDGVYNDFSDLEGLTLECTQALRMGMDGKTLIHPAQIRVANAAFSPTPSAIEEALKIRQAFAETDAAAQNVMQIAGKMVERLHLEEAEELLERHNMIQQLTRPPSNPATEQE